MADWSEQHDQSFKSYQEVLCVSTVLIMGQTCDMHLV